MNMKSISFTVAKPDRPTDVCREWAALKAIALPNRGQTMLPQFSPWLSNSNDITQQFLAIGGMPDFISMAGGLPAAEFYPTEAIANSAGRALSRLGSVGTGVWPGGRFSGTSPAYC